MFSATAYFCDKDNVEQNIAHVAKHFSHEFRPSKCKALDISYCIECHAGALVFCFKLHLEYIYFGRKFFKWSELRWLLPRVFRCWYQCWYSGKNSIILEKKYTFCTLQIRKLYEPKLYPNAPIHSAFDKYFHRKEETLPYICVVGFEPNPKHEEWLISKIKNVH